MGGGHRFLNPANSPPANGMCSCAVPQSRKPHNLIQQTTTYPYPANAEPTIGLRRNIHTYFVKYHFREYIYACSVAIHFGRELTGQQSTGSGRMQKGAVCTLLGLPQRCTHTHTRGSHLSTKTHTLKHPAPKRKTVPKHCKHNMHLCVYTSAAHSVRSTLRRRRSRPRIGPPPSAVNYRCGICEIDRLQA